MKRFSLLAVLCLLLASCNSEPTLQQYFVENTESKDFIALDLTTDILKLNKAKVTSEENAALETLKKMNILAFKADEKNPAKFETERTKIKGILKNEKYQELIKVNSGKEGGAVYFVGKDDAIDEFVLFANKNDAGFAVVRVLGDNMTPTSIMTMLSVLKKADLDIEQLKPLQKMVPN
ncbi:DUF4252 domain-containing protein [Flavobacterium sp. WW92]|jgi:hypothetical protein|uniref:DUF4252 domain-containing protein n=1 Tax=unclassified Flavobacterium TaxID=196869 RepID=UPI002225374E|nr:MULTISPECIES: DUF4252 domain-containing protein [unclassified Flavobacterium]WDO14660.1 DUF4252 domain-containing protein [Flavobacterium sp. WW92]